VAGGRAYVAVGADGLEIYDLGASGTPALLSLVQTAGDALAIRVDANYAYVADFPATIDIINLAP